MLAFSILAHALRQLTGNRRAMMRLAVPSFLVSAALFAVTIGAAVAMVMRTNAGPAAVNFVMWLGTLAATVPFLAMAVGWHRYVLIEEPPRLLGAEQRSAVLRYAGTGLLMLLIIVPTLLAGAILVGIVFSARSRGLGLGMFLAGIPLMMLFMAFTLRLSTALPGAAIGQSRPIRTAWDATKGRLGCFFVIAFVMSVIHNLPVAIIERVAPDGLGGTAITLVWFGLAGLFQLSVVTTLWGHFVENRTLR